jgi:hypothetical protein
MLDKFRFPKAVTRGGVVEGPQATRKRGLVAHGLFATGMVQFTVPLPPKMAAALAAYQIAGERGSPTEAFTYTLRFPRGPKILVLFRSPFLSASVFRHGVITRGGYYS